MENKVIKALFLFLSFTAITWAQSPKETIKSDFTKYWELLKETEFDKALDYVLPEFFEIVPRDQMLTMLEQTLKDPQVEIRFKEARVQDPQDVEEVEGRFYALFSYTSVMSMRLNVEGEANTMNPEATKAALEQSFGSGNVVYDEKDKSFQITSDKKVWAISENGKDTWKFLAIEQQQRPILEKLLPKSLLEKS